MVGKNIIILLVLLIMCSLVVNAEYPYIGYDYFEYDNGFLNSASEFNQTGIKALVDGNYYPLVEDIDNDGVNEVILLNNDDIWIFSDYDLTVEATITLPTVSFGYSPLTIYDIDSDGYPNIMTSAIYNANTGGGTILSYEYNGSSYVQDFNHTIPEPANANTFSASTYLTLIGCGGSSCMGVTSWENKREGSTGTIYIMWAYGFTNSTISGYTVVEQALDNGGGSSAGNNICFPDVPYIQYYDGSYYFSYWFKYNNFATDKSRYFIQKYTLNGTYNPIRDYQRSDDVYKYSTYATCSSRPVPVTSVLVNNCIYGGCSSNEEIVVGYIEVGDYEQYEISVIDDSGTEIDTVGSIEAGEGEYLSNPVLGEIFPDTEGYDYCVMGFEDKDDYVTMLCGSITSTWTNVEFFITRVPVYDIIKENNQNRMYNNLIGLSDQSAVYEDNELVTSVGIFAMDTMNFGDCTGVSDDNCPLYSLIALGYNQSTIIVSDIADTNRADAIIMQDNNVRYLDDGWSNRGAEIQRVCTNPCLDTTWQINTTLSVIVDVIDPDNDLVSARAYLYYNSPYEILQNWTTNFSSGTTIPFTFTVNKTISTATLRIEVRDTENPTDIDYQELAFSVASAGVEYGDCSWCETYDTVLTDDEAEETAEAGTGLGTEGTQDDNTLEDAFRIVGEETHMSGLMIYVLLLGIIIFGIWKSGITENYPQYTFGVIVLVSAIWLILGVLIGVIGIGIIIALVILGLIPAGLWIGKRVLGHGSGE